jgi:hypothetical protein
MLETSLKITKPDELNFILTYGFGDTLTILGLRYALEEKYECRIHFIIKQSHKIVMEMYACTNYSIYEFTHDELIGIGKNNHLPRKGLLYVAHPVFSDNCGIMQKWNNNAVNYKTLLYSFLKIDKNTPIQLPVWYPPLTQTMLNNLNLGVLDLDKTVLLLPEARSVVPLSKKYWKKLVRELRNKGFFVIQSYADEKNKIGDVPALPDDLYIIIAVALSCNCIYALRNGICDLLKAKVKCMTVFYTSEFHYGAYIMEGENIENVFIWEKTKKMNRENINILRVIFRIIKKLFRIFKLEIMSEKSYLSLLNTGNYFPANSNNNNIIIFTRGGGKNRDKIVCIIEFPPEWLASAGFCAIFNRTLNGLYFCERFKFIPVIKGWDSCPYYDGIVNNTDNVFQYYFKHVSDITIEEAEQSSIFIMASNQNMDIAWTENNLKAWYDPPEEYISAMGIIYNKYIQMNLCTGNQIKNDIISLLNNKKTLGLHYRGTDMAVNANGHPISLTYDDYRSYIQGTVKEYEYEQIFLATDDSLFLSQITNDFENVVFYSDVVRATGEVGVHYSKNNRRLHKYRLGYEVIRDVYTLAECDGLICGQSQVPILSRIVKSSHNKQFNPCLIISKGLNDNNKDWMSIHQKQQEDYLSTLQVKKIVNNSFERMMWIDPSDEIVVQAGKMCFLQGWAVDIDLSEPLSKLYVKVKNTLIRCNYGFQRPEVGKDWGKPKWIKVGFNVSIPVLLLENEDEVEFILVGNNESYQYEPVVYKIKNLNVL